jgi:hypothetical protein
MDNNKDCTTNKLTLVDLDDILLRSAVASAVNIHTQDVIKSIKTVVERKDSITAVVAHEIIDRDLILIDVIFNIIKAKDKAVHY